MEEKQKAVLVTRDELIILADFYNTNKLPGFDNNYLEEKVTSIDEIEDNLIKRGILEKNVGGLSISNDYYPVFASVFHPEKVLVIVRDEPDFGKQKGIFLKKSSLFLFHAQPEENKHALLLIDQTFIITFIKEWFKEIPATAESKEDISLPVTIFESARIAVEKNDTTKAMDILTSSEITSSQATKIVKTIAQRKISGSFASFNVENSTTVDVQSFAVFADPISTWVIIENKHPQNIRLVREKGILHKKIEQMTGDFFMDNKKEFRSYIITEEMLATALHLINRADLGYRILFPQPDEGDEEAYKKILSENLPKLENAGLCLTSEERSFPTLDKHFEEALFPIAKYDYLLRVRISYAKHSSHTSIYIINKRMFTSHLIVGEKNILESGVISSLPNYISELFKGLHPTKDTTGLSEIQLHYGTLIDAIKQENDINKIYAILENDNIPDKSLKLLVSDLSKTVFRGSLVLSRTNYQASQEDINNAPKPTILILQGSEYSWIFTFPSIGIEQIGSGSVVTREQFLKEISNFIN